jgi:hypothetical protein
LLDITIEDVMVELLVRLVAIREGEVVVKTVLLVVATSSAATVGTSIKPVGVLNAMKGRLVSNNTKTMITELTDESLKYPCLPKFTRQRLIIP